MSRTRAKGDSEVQRKREDGHQNRPKEHLLSCGHKVRHHVPPTPGDMLYCMLCQDFRKAVGKKSAGKRSRNKGEDDE